MHLKRYINAILTTVIPLILVWSCSRHSSNTNMPTPHSEEELGKLLFFDSILSRDNQVSCASCHKPEFAFADNTALSFGVDSLTGNRNAPSVMNLANHSPFFWDGRAESLDEQAKGPIENPVEMDIPLSVAVKKINKRSDYLRFFQSIYGQKATPDLVVKAITAYENSLQTTNTPFDDFAMGKDTGSFSPSAKRGRKLFVTKAKCFDCHFGPDFTMMILKTLDYLMVKI